MYACSTRGGTKRRAAWGPKVSNLPGPKQERSFIQHRRAERPAANDLSRRFVLRVDINEIVFSSKQVEYYPTFLDCQASRNKGHDDQRDVSTTNSTIMPRNVQFTEQQRSYSHMSTLQRARR